jgi:hypothetical protein
MAGSERISRHRANLFRAILAHLSDPNKLLIERITSEALSDSTVRRLLRRMGFSQKTDCGGDGARRMAEGRLEGDSS